jgi:hypothetical protein
MLPSNQHPSPESKADCGWSWLKSRLDRTALLEATHELDEWVGAELRDLERNYDQFVTTESRKLVAGSVVSSNRRK